MPVVDFQTVRRAITMEQVLDLLGVQPSKRSRVQWQGSCPLDASPSDHRRSFSVKVALCCYNCHGYRNRGCHKAAPAPASDRSLSSAGPRRSLDQALVMASSLVVRVTPRATSSPDRTEHGLHRSGGHARRWTYIMPTQEKRPPVLSTSIQSHDFHRLS